MGLGFQDDEHKRDTLALCQVANLHNQMPLTKEELWLIYHYPATVRQLMTITF